MNITLIRPPAYSTGLMGAQRVPFLGIAYIAAAARSSGNKVDIIDMCAEDIEHTEVVHGKYVAYGMTFSGLSSRIKPSDIIGFTCMFSQDWVFNRELISYVSKLAPEAIIVAGGEHISALPEYCLDSSPELDICVLGEGEEVFVNLLNALKNKDELSHASGLVCRLKGQEGYLRTPKASRIRDIDNIPWPAWDLIPLENYLVRNLNYHIMRGHTIPLLASRGCPYKCTFCSNTNMWGNPWIPRNPALLADEMEYYIKHYQADNFVFSDLTAVVNKEPLIQLCNEIIKRNLKITWQLPTLRTEVLDRRTLELMHRAGCRDLDFAIESGSKHVLGSVNKRNDPKKISSLIKEGLNTGMNLSSNIILGLPEETLRDFLKTYWLVVRLAVMGLQEVNVFPFIPYPGSRLFEDFRQKKIITLNDRYFLGLFGYADLSQAISWSKRFGPRTLSFMRLTLIITFYGTMFVSHPVRLVRLVINTLKGVPATKLENVLSRIFKNIVIYFSHKRGYARQNT